MTCRICKGYACTESFHSIEEQEEFETKTGRYAPEDEEARLMKEFCVDNVPDLIEEMEKDSRGE